MWIGIGLRSCEMFGGDTLPFSVYDVAYLISGTTLESDQAFEKHLELSTHWNKQTLAIARQFWYAGQIRQPVLEGLPSPGVYLSQTWLRCPAKEVESFYNQRLWVAPEVDDFSYATWRLTSEGWRKPDGLIETKRSLLKSPVGRYVPPVANK